MRQTEQHVKTPELSTTAKQQSTVRWVVAIAAIALIFDGYDLVVYGTIVSTLLSDPTQLGEIGPATAGVLGSWALFGVMVGALTTGAVGDYLGRRKIMITGIIWFSVFMGLTALAPNVVAFGALRFATGLGVGALVATAGAVVAEFAPKGKRNYYNAIVYSGVPVGGVLASLLAIVLLDHIGWRGLFLIGATPLLFLLPMALTKLPESPEWLMARGRTEEAQRASIRTGVPLAAPVATGAHVRLPEPVAPKIGFRALASKKYALPTLLLGLMSFAGLMLTYGLNTWLPQIMSTFGYGKSYSLAFLLVLNAGAVFGGLIASVGADRVGAKRVVSTTFFLAALAMVLLTMQLPFGILLGLVAVAGVGTIGTQVLIYGFVSNYYDSAARGAGVAWCAGFGRLGGIFGPLIGGLLIAAGVENHVAFYVFAGVAIVGALVTACVPLKNSETRIPVRAAKARAGITH
ncbi:aromatic acid/H+ symport family MFS transporter [Paeniglutamicibacter gangotriensis]|uniref:Aromatic acid/H+ symport family MFS transporter n=1 Tax=Paeniglutamicibacter gangotriensis TaxID=254787 RepID=A0A5B0EE05_9MICC|nr:aromatic acid/H+ symport family MFS transporter [Paeniglutamicibacter gangotriensis]